MRTDARSIVNGTVMQRGAGDCITVGMCPLCGRKVGLSGANKTGARCRYDGAQFDANGRLVWAPTWKVDAVLDEVKRRLGLMKPDEIATEFAAVENGLEVRVRFIPE